MRAPLFALCGTVFLACDPGTPAVTLDSFFPKANEVGGYAENTALGKPGVQIAKTTTAIQGLVNGDAGPFLEKGTIAFAWERYVSGTYELDARVWQMKNAANCTETYDFLVTDAALYAANTWVALSVGVAGRIADTGTSWWVNARKGAYIIEVRVTPKDDTSRADVEAFAKAMAGKIP